MVNAKLLGSVIQKCRKSRPRKTQEVVSGLAGLDRTHYSKIERGLRSPTIDTFYKIALALDMQPHELMLEVEKAVQAQDQKE